MKPALCQLAALALSTLSLAAGEWRAVPAATPAEEAEARRLAAFLPPTQDLARVVEAPTPAPVRAVTPARRLTPPSQRVETPVDEWLSPQMRAKVQALRRAGAFD